MATYDSSRSDPPRARHAAQDADIAAVRQGPDRSWVIMLVGAVITFGFGLVVIVWPHATLTVIAVLLGIQLLAFGLIRLISVTVALLAILVGLYWVIHGVVDLIVAATAGPVPGRWVKALIGLISLAAGLIVMFKPKESLKFLLVVLGIYLMLYGVLLAVWAFQTRRLGAHIGDG